MRAKAAALAIVTTLAATLSAAPVEAISPSGRSTHTQVASARTVRTFSPEYMAGKHSVTKEQAIAIARRFKVIFTTPYNFRTWAGLMHEANPGLKLLVYLNGMFALPDQASSFPRAWYSFDKQGRKVRSRAFGTYLMNPLNSGWISNRAKECSQRIAGTRFDGCFLDTLGAAPTAAGYVTSVPVNPKTGRPWKQDDWLRATSNLAAKVREALAPKVIMGNGLASGNYYFAGEGSSKILLRGLAGAMAEIWLRVHTSPITEFPSETTWKKNVDMLVDAGKQRSAVLALTKAWGAGTRAQKDAWHKFALASYLLGRASNSYFCFSYEKNAAGLTKGHPWWKVRLGTPSAPYQKMGGWYRRVYSRGLAIVNPTSNTYTVKLNGTFVTLSGKKVSSVRLSPHGAEVLREV